MRKRILVVVLLSALLLSIAYISVQSSGSGTSLITYIDVGQGDSELIQDPAGFDVLIDGGPTTAGSVVVDYLRVHTDKSLEVVLISHPDEDHIGGLLALLQAGDISVDQIVYNGYPGSTQTWNSLVTLANSRAIPMNVAQFPDELHWGQLDAHILNPAANLSDPDTNDASIVARIDYNNTKFMFTGDISSPIEAAVIARQTPLASNVLKVAHHGSSSSSSSPFLAAVQPTGAVISVGAGNPYGHPAADTLARLSAAGIRVWRTDQSGTILMTSDGLTVNFPSNELNIQVFLPMIVKMEMPTPISTPVPTSVVEPPPPSGANVVCNFDGTAQLCAWVSNASPAKNSAVTVYGRLIIANNPQSAQSMTTTWHYKSSTPSCSGTTDSTGVASCSRSIGNATSAYAVNVDVSIAGHSATTSFTPQ